MNNMQFARPLLRLVVFAAAVLTLGTLFTLSTGNLLAQESPPVQEGPAPRNVTMDEVNEVAKDLWCPLCSGVRLDTCELKACEQMKDVIAIKLAEGEDSKAIQDYFFAQYGPEVLGAPPFSGFNVLAWLLPFAVLILGGVFLMMQARRMVRPQTAEAGAAPRRGQEPDEYERRLEEELTRYG